MKTASAATPLMWLIALGILASCGGNQPVSSTDDQDPSPLAKPAGEELISAGELTKDQAAIIATVTRNGIPQSNVEVALSRSICGQSPDYRWKATTDANGEALVEIADDGAIPRKRGASGYYLAKATDRMGEIVGRWGSIPIKGGKVTTLALPIGESAAPARPPLEVLDSFYLRVTPKYMADAIGGQHCVITVDVEDFGGSDAGGPVVLAASAPGAEVRVVPEVIAPGQVAEITVVPMAVPSDEPGPIPLLRPTPKDLIPPGPIRPGPDDGLIPVDPCNDPYGLGPKEVLTVTIVGERGDEVQTQAATIVVRPGEDLTLEAAAAMRDRFMPWLSENHPELGISAQADWTGTIVTPHILVVTHYLFLTDEWEMEVRWHVMIPPHDWAEIYLRRRGVETRPSLAYKIDSVSGNTTPHSVAPPETVWR